MNAKPRSKPPRFIPKRRRPAAQPIHLKPAADSAVRQALQSIGVPELTPFSPDPFQCEAVAAIQEADCLVTAPTGAGKTWIAVQAISRIRAVSGRAWYATPLKALSNAKFNEFSEIFGQDQVGILTGDRKERPDAPIIVGTTEILRNQLYDTMHQGETLDTDMVILDEAHFLGDSDRGVVWEETMIYLPSRIPLLLLSATIGNAGQIAEWLSAIRSKECRVVEATQRPVPLYPLFFHPSGTLLPLLSQSAPGKGRMSSKVREYIRNEKSQRWPIPPGQLPPLGEILRVLHHFDLLPAIFFLKSRADCDHALELCREYSFDDDPAQKEALHRRVSDIISQSPHLKHHRQIWHLRHLALAAHHSGQLPAWKQVIETLMTEGLLQAVFATSTVAAGVNFPARTVAFLNTDRFNGVEFMPLTPTEFHQMTGRAGRRGMDNIGFAAAIPGKYLDIPLCAKLAASPSSDVISQLRINFSMVLNLLLSHPPDQIENLLMRSFATFLRVRTGSGKFGSEQPALRHRILIQEFNRHLEFLKQTRFVAEDGALTRDGLWASQLRVDQPLLIVDGFRKRAFPESDPALMAAVMALFVSDREYDDRIDRHAVPRELMDAVIAIRSALKPLMRNMYDQDFDIRPLHLKPAMAVYAWASGRAWQDVIALSEGAEGDLVMLMLRTADHLRHVVGLTKTFPEAAQTAATAIGLLLKEPVLLEIA